MKIPFKPSNLPALAASAVVALIANSAHADQVLVNFGNTAYTGDDSNTWQTFDLNGASTNFVNVPSPALLPPLSPALRSGPTAVSGATRQKQIPASRPMKKPPTRP